jgi:ADP-ribosylglycohydrolase
VLGAIAGDVIGSPYEHRSTKRTDFPLLSGASRFTDDTVLTVATAEALLGDGDYAAAYRRWGLRHPHAGYGGTFIRWIHDPGMGPYDSWGNGSAMRVSPVGWALGDAEAVLAEGERTAAVSHDHPEGIRGAQAVALSIFLLRRGSSRKDLSREIETRFGYDLSRTPDEIRPGYGFDVSCQGSVPEAISCFLHTEGFEEAVRAAVSLGGDADTQACIAGALAEAEGGVPPDIAERVRHRLTPEMLDVLDRFRDRHA